MIVFSDPHVGFGGGQLVLRTLLERMKEDFCEIVVFQPESGFNKLGIRTNVININSFLKLFLHIRRNSKQTIVFVSNANRSLISDYLFICISRLIRLKVEWVSIVHNYPGSKLSQFVVNEMHKKCSYLLPVEPGVARGANIVRLPLLAPIGVEIPTEYKAPGNLIKSFARADPVKGMHLLPEIFRKLESAGYQCQVALAPPISGPNKYQRNLKNQLAPWLLPDQKDNSWLQPGDIFLVPSISETTCLAAQEALVRGAFVVSSKIGVMPQLISGDSSLFITETTNVDSFIQSVTCLADLDPLSAIIRSEKTSIEIATRAGLFQSEVIRVLSELSKTK